MRIVNEPTAAAIAYGLDAKSKERKGGSATQQQQIGNRSTTFFFAVQFLSVLRQHCKEESQKKAVMLL